ncbi:MAG: hypothetical protein M3155_02465, partial [Actinomycetota bacterium]|nr:hypothetical protein [Actinomycetota bacterium]
RCRYTPAVKALGQLGITLAKARDVAQPTLADEGDEPAADGRGAAGNPLKERGLTKHAHAVLERSLHESIHRGEGFIGVEHLLLALIHDAKSGATQTLGRLGATPDDVHRALESAW